MLHVRRLPVGRTAGVYAPEACERADRTPLYELQLVGAAQPRVRPRRRGAGAPDAQRQKAGERSTVGVSATWRLDASGSGSESSVGADGDAVEAADVVIADALHLAVAAEWGQRSDSAARARPGTVLLLERGAPAALDEPPAAQAAEEQHFWLLEVKEACQEVRNQSVPLA